jgi:hypothetical protein
MLLARKRKAEAEAVVEEDGLTRREIKRQRLGPVHSLNRKRFVVWKYVTTLAFNDAVDKQFIEPRHNVCRWDNDVLEFEMYADQMQRRNLPLLKVGKYDCVMRLNKSFEHDTSIYIEPVSPAPPIGTFASFTCRYATGYQKRQQRMGMIGTAITNCLNVPDDDRLCLQCRKEKSKHRFVVGCYLYRDDRRQFIDSISACLGMLDIPGKEMVEYLYALATTSARIECRGGIKHEYQYP